MTASVSQPEPRPAQPATKTAEQSSQQAMSDCPQCGASLAVLRIIPGKAGDEYWTMRCTKCGGIHLDIVKVDSPAPAPAVQDSSDIFA